jgi:hypothetical protein
LLRNFYVADRRGAASFLTIAILLLASASARVKQHLHWYHGINKETSVGRFFHFVIIAISEFLKSFNWSGEISLMELTESHRFFHYFFDCFEIHDLESKLILFFENHQLGFSVPRTLLILSLKEREREREPPKGISFLEKKKSISPSSTLVFSGVQYCGQSGERTFNCQKAADMQILCGPGHQARQPVTDVEDWRLSW